MVSDVFAGLFGRAGILREDPGGDVTGVDGPRVGDQQRCVVVRPGVVGQQGRDHCVAQVVQAPDVVVLVGCREGGHRVLGEDLLQSGQSLVDEAGGGFDESVGVQDQQALLGQEHLVRFERWLGGSQWRVGGQVGPVDSAVGMDDDRWG